MIAVCATFFNQLQTRLRRALHWSPPVLDTLPLHPPTTPLPLAQPDALLPAFVAACPVAQHYRALLGDLAWAQFPDLPPDRTWSRPERVSRAAFVAAYLVKLHEGKPSMPALRTFLLQHPALVWLLGFPLVPDPTASHGFNVAATVPTRRQFNRVLRDLHPEALQFLLTSSITLLHDMLAPDDQAHFGDVVAGDTKHILAWVKENNPRQYVPERFDPQRQPAGDPDCKLGVKRRTNQGRRPTVTADDAPVPTPTTDAKPASVVSQAVDKPEYIWGYASGVIVTRLPGSTDEIVLAERTRPFNESDISYFFPLMEQVEQRLGHRPPTGTFDAAFDAHYVYDYFHQAGGFAAVPLVARNSDLRRFSSDGLPLCKADLAMPCKFTYRDRTNTLVPHERGKHVCPLLHPTPTGDACPIDDPHWAKGGCATTVATGAGARVRVQLDRDSADYKAIYAQRTMPERINSQAKELGIERPKLRNQRSITNANTLIYVLINLRVYQRIRARQSDARPEVVPPVTS